MIKKICGIQRAAVRVIVILKSELNKLVGSSNTINNDKLVIL